MTPTAPPPGAMRRTLTDSERLAALRLIRSDNVGAATFADLVAHFGSAAAALDALPGLRGGRALRVCPAEDAERERDAIAALGGHILCAGEDGYPPWLAAIDGAPPVLTVRGNLACLMRPMIAVVGARNASIAGRKFALQLAAGLGEAGFVVASGLARGIDGAAHTGALATGTIAVFAGGLDQLYPPEHAQLADDILANGGAHISEMPLGHNPRARDFPRRNRIISGVSVAVVVVEAALRSGSLITARLANEQGRLVFAVPGSPLDPRAGGTNHLIKDGAHIVTELADVVAEVAPMIAREPEPLPFQPSAGSLPDGGHDEDGASGSDRVVNALGTTPVEIDEIIRFTGLTAASVRLALIELDLAGRIERHPGGRVSRAA